MGIPIFWHVGLHESGDFGADPSLNEFLKALSADVPILV